MTSRRARSPFSASINLYLRPALRDPPWYLELPRRLHGALLLDRCHSISVFPSSLPSLPFESRDEDEAEREFNRKISLPFYFLRSFTFSLSLSLFVDILHTPLHGCIPRAVRILTLPNRSFTPLPCLFPFPSFFRIHACSAFEKDGKERERGREQRLLFVSRNANNLRSTMHPKPSMQTSLSTLPLRINDSCLVSDSGTSASSAVQRWRAIYTYIPVE